MWRTYFEFYWTLCQNELVVVEVRDEALLLISSSFIPDH